MNDRIARLHWLAILIAAIWAVEIVNLATGYRLNQWFGLLPRTAWGLTGVPLMPLLHGSIAHASANTVPVLIFGLLMQLSAPRRLALVSVLIVIASGLAVWLFGRSSIHVGASGLIFGWFGFLIARGYFERTFGSIAIALAVGILYGGFIWGVLPLHTRISWEAHLFGALAGIAAAWLFRDEPAGGSPPPATQQ
ncbi:MAG: rhomboid family intramembrane serine protease [Beijerinckiaceae bacterium]